MFKNSEGYYEACSTVEDSVLTLYNCCSKLQLSLDLRPQNPTQL